MNRYEKRLLGIHNRMAHITLVEYQRQKATQEVTAVLLDSAISEYDRLADDIVNCRDIMIGEREFVIQERTK